jgi:hypothetical protein
MVKHNRPVFWLCDIFFSTRAVATRLAHHPDKKMPAVLRRAQPKSGTRRRFGSVRQFGTPVCNQAYRLHVEQMEEV